VLGVAAIRASDLDSVLAIRRGHVLENVENGEVGSLSAGVGVLERDHINIQDATTLPYGVGTRDKRAHLGIVHVVVRANVSSNSITGTSGQKGASGADKAVVCRVFDQFPVVADDVPLRVALETEELGVVANLLRVDTRLLCVRSHQNFTVVPNTDGEVSDTLIAIIPTVVESALRDEDQIPVTHSVCRESRHLIDLDNLPEVCVNNRGTGGSGRCIVGFVHQLKR